MHTEIQPDLYVLPVCGTCPRVGIVLLTFTYKPLRAPTQLREARTITSRIR